MRLPQIIYDQPVQKRGRYESQASQIVLETAQLEARGTRRSGEMLAGAERSGGEMISDAMRQAARNLAQAELDAEKYKNDKVAQYSIQAAQFDIESKLAGDILKIKEDRDKYILDREYERDYNILGIKTGLEEAKFAIESASAWRKLDINSQLQLELLDIKTDAAWRNTFIQIGTNLAKTALNAYVANQNTKLEAEVTSRASNFAKDLALLEADLTGPNTTIDLDAPQYEGLNLRDRMPEGVVPHISTTGVGDKEYGIGKDATTVPKHEMGMVIFNAKVEQLRAEAVSGIDSTAHLADLEMKLDNIEFKNLVSVVKDMAEKARNWDAAMFTSSYDDYVESNDLENAVKTVNKGVSLGVYTPERGRTMIEQANVQIKYSGFLNRIDGASTKAILENIKGDANNSGLPETRINQIRSQADAKMDKLVADDARSIYEQSRVEVMAMARPVGAVPGSPEFQNGYGYSELESMVAEKLEKGGHDQTTIDKYKNEFYTDYARTRAAAMEIPNAVNEEAETYWENGQQYPTDNNPAYDQMPQAFKDKIDRKNNEIRKGGKISTDWAYYGDMMDAAVDEDHPMRKEFLKTDFYGIDDKSWNKLAPTQRKELREAQMSAQKGELDFKLTELKYSNSLFKANAKAAFGKLWESDPDDLARANQLRSVINNRIKQVEMDQGKPVTENQINEIMNNAFTMDINERRARRTRGAVPYKTVTVGSLHEGRVADSMVYLSNELVRADVPATPENISGLYNLLAKGILNAGEKPSPELIKQYFGKLQAAGVPWFGAM